MSSLYVIFIIILISSFINFLIVYIFYKDHKYRNELIKGLMIGTTIGILTFRLILLL